MNREKIIEKWSKVKENVLDNAPRNYREIDVPQGTIIVLGYDERKGDFSSGDKAYAIMGAYNGGEMKYVVSLLDFLELCHINAKGIDIGSKLDFGCETEMDTAMWWRVPTDEEMEFYNMVYAKNVICKDINKLISEIEGGGMNDEDIIEYLEDLKCSIVKM